MGTDITILELKGGDNHEEIQCTEAEGGKTYSRNAELLNCILRSEEIPEVKFRYLLLTEREVMNMTPSRDVFVQYRVINGNKFIMKNYHVFQLDEIGELVWDALDGETTVKQIIENISKIYDVQLETVEHDIDQFIKELLEKELIEV
jgi:hypothetical protein